MGKEKNRGRGGRCSEITRGEEDGEDRRQEKGEDVHEAACVWAQRGRMRAVRGRDGAMEEQDGRIRTEGGRRGGADRDVSTDQHASAAVNNKKTFQHTGFPGVGIRSIRR